MAGKDYLRGTLLALLWLALLLAGLYAAARLVAQPQNMRWLIMLMLISWPVVTGLLGGWQAGKQEKNGFAAGLRQVAVPLALIAVLWWWLLPKLWQAGSYGKFALYVLAAALLCGGLGAGLVKARQMLYPPPPPEEDEEKDID